MQGIRRVKLSYPQSPEVSDDKFPGLVVPSTCCWTIDDRFFVAVASRLCNSLMSRVTSLSSPEQLFTCKLGGRKPTYSG